MRRRETIFGPDVGEDDEPGWTKPEDGVKIGVDVVKGWVDRAKSEEVSYTLPQDCNRYMLIARVCTLPLRSKL